LGSFREQIDSRTIKNGVSRFTPLWHGLIVAAPKGKFLIVMINIDYTTRVFPYPKYGSVCVRVRWNKKQNSVDFTTGDFVEIEKWDPTIQRAKVNTKHVVRGHEQTAGAINKRIGVVLGYVDEIFQDFAKNDELPDKGAFRAAMRVLLAKENVPTDVPTKSLSLEKMDTICKRFIESQSLEASWKDHSKFKYTQVVGHLLKSNPGIRINQIDKKALLRLREWYFKQGRHNPSIARWFSSLRAILRWARENGYEVKDEALNFKHRVSVPEKRITYLKYDELLAFHQFEYPEGTPLHIIRARDMFCFMAFTSLRYSDMSTLKKADITPEHIQIYTVKTRDKLQIPILSYAQEIIDKYKNLPGEMLFPAPSNQKLNDFIKDAAKLAGLNRVVVETYFIDKERHEKVSKLWETLSCHDGRRTFVCCSLQLGITPTTVMKCTGHAKYENMKPYIEVADEAVAKEMGLWETTEIKREIINHLDSASEDVLKKVLKLLKK
jgi:integrase